MDTPASAAALPTDTRGRALHDLRISVTDRCNFRCVYCMPKSVFGAEWRFLDRKDLLSFEEIERVARAFVRCGVRKLRLTGGEPLVRRQLETLAFKGLHPRLLVNQYPPVVLDNPMQRTRIDTGLLKKL